jgi:hypothetical protein
MLLHTIIYTGIISEFTVTPIVYPISYVLPVNHMIYDIVSRQTFLILFWQVLKTTKKQRCRSFQIFGPASRTRPARLYAGMTDSYLHIMRKHDQMEECETRYEDTGTKHQPPTKKTTTTTTMKDC